MFVKKTILGIALASAIGLGASTASAAVIDSYFGMNYVAGGLGDEVQLLSVTYENGTLVPKTGCTFPSICIGFEPARYTVQMPAFPQGQYGGPWQGLPDIIDSLVPTAYAPTYTTRYQGNGESTYTVGAALPINWSTLLDAASGSPYIRIVDLTVDTQWGVKTLSGDYTIALVPHGTGTELWGGQCYGEFGGCGTGNDGDIYRKPTGDFWESGNEFGGGTFTFAAAAVMSNRSLVTPVPAAVWLFGSGLLGLAGVARRRKASR